VDRSSFFCTAQSKAGFKMSFTTIFIIGGVVLLFIFFLIAKLAIRWAIRMLIIGLVLIALLGGGGFWWWSNRLAPKPVPSRQRPAPAKPAQTR
jgi:protein-S-isoprenylcysteine O-methyltransferase Ste14